jgi:hypothetical protein
MNIIKDNGALRTIIVYGGLLAIVIGGLYSAYMIFNNILLTNRTMQSLNILMGGKAIGTNQAHTVSVLGLNMSYKALAVSIGIAFAGFAVFYSILTTLSGPIKTVVSALMVLVGVILAVVTAQSWLKGTFGLEGVAGLLGVGAVMAGATSLAGQATGSFAVGTRSAPYTGLAMIHKGEHIYNPAVNRPAGLEQEVMGTPSRATPSTVTVNFNGDINTKASVEEIDDRFGRKIYRAVKGAS